MKEFAGPLATSVSDPVHRFSFFDSSISLRYLAAALGASSFDEFQYEFGIALVLHSSVTKPANHFPEASAGRIVVWCDYKHMASFSKLSENTCSQKTMHKR